MKTEERIKALEAALFECNDMLSFIANRIELFNWSKKADLIVVKCWRVLGKKCVREFLNKT